MQQLIAQFTAFGPIAGLIALALVLTAALLALLIAGKDRDAEVKAFGITFAVRCRKNDDGPPEFS